MSVMPYATVVGVFRNRSAADLAMEALLDAGFKKEQIRYLVAGNTGGFLDNLKSVFSGINPAEEHLVSNLTDMGLTGEEAQYFSDEYARGSAILAIKTQGDDQMALNILYRYGAYNARDKANSFSGVTPPGSQQAQSATETPVYANSVQGQEAQPEPQIVEEHSTQDHQQVEATANSSIEVRFQPVQPTSFGFNPQAYDVEIIRRDQTTPLPEAMPDNSTEPLAQETASDQGAPLPQGVAETPVDGANSGTSEIEEMDDVEEVVKTPVYDDQIDLPGSEVVEADESLIPEADEPTPQAMSVDTEPEIEVPQAASAYARSESELPEAPMPQPNSDGGYAYTDELQQLLAQIQITKQQLQEARSQLEAIKEREGQLTAARLQLKELQTELQATQEELRSTQQRIVG